MSDKKEDSSLKKAVQAVADMTSATILASMTGEQRDEMITAGFNYSLRSRKLPHLSDACIAYMMQADALKPHKEEERSIVYND